VWLIFSTFLPRCSHPADARGLVSSSTAFAQSSIGAWFTTFMVIVAAVCIFVYILQRSHLKTEHTLDSLSAANPASYSTIWCCSPPASVILWGTSVPIISGIRAKAPRSPSARLSTTACRCPSHLPALPHRRWAAVALARHLVQAIPATLCCADRSMGHGRGLLRGGADSPFSHWFTEVGSFLRTARSGRLGRGHPSAISSRVPARAGVIARQTGKNLLVGTWI